jgi:hypothetical protein
MKVLIFLLVEVFVATCQQAIPPVVVQPVLEEATWCMIRTVATLPPKPIVCTNPNEIFACGYGEARCDGFGFCGTVMNDLYYLS